MPARCCLQAQHYHIREAPMPGKWPVLRSSLFRGKRHTYSHTYLWARPAAVVGGRKKASAWRGALEQQEANTAAATTVAGAVLSRQGAARVLGADASDADADASGRASRDNPKPPMFFLSSLRRQVWAWLVLPSAGDDDRGDALGWQGWKEGWTDEGYKGRKREAA